MHIIFFMIGVSLVMALGFLGAFIWSMRTGQQDDLYTPALRMLLDDAPPDDRIPDKLQQRAGERQPGERRPVTPTFSEPSTTTL